MNNARLKRGRKPSTPAQEPHGKRKPTIPTERHFETLTPEDQAAQEECSSELRVQNSSFFSCEQRPTTARDILPLPAVSEKNASSIDEELNKPQAAEILLDAGIETHRLVLNIIYKIQNQPELVKISSREKRTFTFFEKLVTPLFPSKSG